MSKYQNREITQFIILNRWIKMNTHEFQAKQILLQYGITIPDFYVASSIEEVKILISQHHLQSGVVKMQVHAGGRGKSGGVKIAKNAPDLIKAAEELIGKKMINEQTGPEGMISHQILISSLVSIKKEFYLGITINRELARRVLIASPIGGIEIEKIAQEQPDQVLILPIPNEGNFKSYHFLRIAKFMGWEGKQKDEGVTLIQALIKAFQETDASLLEINPLVETDEGDLVALDAKLSIDDNALFRQEKLKNLFDPTQVSQNEARAQQHELAYVALDGDIGCMVNGAGLAMATMDLIQYHGGRPANFLDVGGGASQEKVAEGFRIILSDKKVKVILINIFGGIMNCETLAAGIIEAAKGLQIHVPLIVRMEGTNVEKGKQLIQQSGLKIVIAKDLTEAAEKAVQSGKRVG
jgi:succinyl-CoA synthetase beta subunit